MARAQEMRFTVATTLAAALVAPLLVVAADTSNCSSATTQAEMNACAANELAEADRQLNEVYQSVLKKHAGNTAFTQKLRAAQRAWVTFRDAELDSTYACAAPNPAACWGSLLPQRYASYKAKLTCERTERLRELLVDGPPADRTSL